MEGQLLLLLLFPEKLDNSEPNDSLWLSAWCTYTHVTVGSFYSVSMRTVDLEISAQPRFRSDWRNALARRMPHPREDPIYGGRCMENNLALLEANHSHDWPASASVHVPPFKAVSLARAAAVTDAPPALPNKVFTTRFHVRLQSVRGGVRRQMRLQPIFIIIAEWRGIILLRHAEEIVRFIWMQLPPEDIFASSPLTRSHRARAIAFDCLPLVPSIQSWQSFQITGSLSEQAEK